MAKVMKAWALCHRGTPLIVYTQWRRRDVLAECAAYHTVMRVEVHVPEKKPRAATKQPKRQRAKASSASAAK